MTLVSGRGLKGVLRVEAPSKIHASDGDLRGLETILIWETFKYSMVSPFLECIFYSNHEHS